ncbi:MAG: M48 family metalloprotease [Calditrichaeota bacterium]|nr:M48 family metalloprotease [Calditrichota bacterium]
MAPSIPWEIIRFQRERELTRMLESVLHAPIILKLGDQMALHRRHFFRDVVIMGQGVQLHPQVTPQLWEQIQRVLQRLSCQLEVDFYILSQPTMNAFTSMEQDPEGRFGIFFHSRLIEILSPAEFQFVVGHELGHLLFGTYRLQRTLNLAYKGGTTLSYALRNLVQLWYKFHEISADRIGYLACGDLQSCITSLIKLASGVNLNFQRFDLSRYLDRNRKILQHIDTHSVRQMETHPLPAIRVRALELFSQSKLVRQFGKRAMSPDPDLQRQMDELTVLLEARQDSELDYYRQLFIVTGGMVVATLDQEIRPEEKDKILQTLAIFRPYPQNYIQKVLAEIQSGDELFEVFVESAARVLSLDASERHPMFNFLIEMAFADGKIRDIEMKFLLDVGTQVMGFTQKEIYEMILTKLSSGAFVPRIEFP